MRDVARKASDLILETTGIWLNIDPSHPIEIGDYGEIGLETGRFTSLGNIYKSEGVKTIVPDIDQCPPQLGEVVDEEKLKSKEASSWSFDVDPALSVSEVLNGAVQLQFNVVNERRAAYLIAKTSRTDYLPKNRLLKRLSNVKELAKMYLVTERTICYGYSVGVTTIAGTNSSTKVETSATLPAAPSASTGGRTSSTSKANATVDWSVSGDKNEFTYVPTFKIMRLHPYWSNSLLGIVSYAEVARQLPEKDIWINATPPWAPLDEEGNEVLPEDEVI